MSSQADRPKPALEFDVFLSHSSADKSAVARIAEALRARGFKPWLDAEQVVPGIRFQPQLAEGLAASRSVAVVVGAEPVGDWVHEELDAAIARSASDRSFRVFLVLLPDAPEHFDPTGLHQFLSQRTWVDLRRIADDDGAADQLARAVRGEPLGLVSPAVDTPQVCPYVGLRAFDIDDARWFFGRDADIQRMTEKLGESPFLSVLGRSGAGKSSAVRAGLIPALTAGQLIPGSEDWTIRVLRPTAAPLEVLAAHLGELRPDLTSVGILEQLTSSDVALKLLTAARGERRPVVWVIDQAEELYTLCDDATARRAFTANLLHASQAGGPARVVVTLRSDFYARFAEDPAFSARIAHNQHVVTDLDNGQLAQAVTQPADLVGLSLQPGLVERITGDVRAQSGGLPLLQHALRELWQRRQGSVLTHDAYHEIEGVAGALAAHAEAAFAALDRDGDGPVARRLLVELVQLGEGAEATKQPVQLADLVAPAYPMERLHRVAATLADARLVTTGTRRLAPGLGDSWAGSGTPTGPVAEPDIAPGTTVELAHDTVIRSWPRLRSWIDESRDELRTCRRMREAALAWQEQGRPADMLYRGTVLAVARAHLSDRRSEMHDVEVEFLKASIDREESEHAQVRRRRIKQLRALGSLTAITVIVAIVASAMAVLFYDARADVEVERDHAQSREAALIADDLREIDPGLAARLALVGYSISPTVEARSAVLSFSDVPTSERHLGGNGPTALAALPDGSMTAASNAIDGTVQIFTRVDGSSRRAGTVPAGSADITVHALAFTPDGNVLITGDNAAEITVWDLTDPTRPKSIGEPFQGPSESVERLVVSPDGAELAAAGEGGGVYRWDIRDPAAPRPLATLPSSSDITWSISYHPTRRHLAVSDDAGDVVLWNLDGDPEPLTTITIGSPVFAVSLSPDGDLLAAGSRDGRLQVWDVSTPSAPRPVELTDGQFGSWVTTVSFSTDGRYLVAGSSDQSIRVWDRTSWTPVAVFRHPAALTNAMFVDDGRTVISTATDGTTRWWDLSSALQATVDGPSWGVSYDSTGERLAMFSGKEARVWDTSSGPPGPDLLAHVKDLTGIDDGLSGTGALSPDGTQLALGSLSSGDVYLVNLSHPDEPRLATAPLGGSNRMVETVAFSPDGTVLAAGGDDEAIRLWTLDTSVTSEPTAQVGELAGIVFNVAWSHDGRYLAAASSERVYLFDVTDPTNPKKLAELEGFEDEAYAVAFNPDDTVLAAGGPNGTVELWDITHPAAPQQIGEPLTGPGTRIFDLAFDPSGNYLAAAVRDGTTWLWDTDNVHATELLAVLDPPDAAIHQVEFDPRTGALAASGVDGLLYLWPPDVDQAIERLCDHLGDPIIETEWATYFPDTTYAPPCQRRPPARRATMTQRTRHGRFHR